MAQIEVEDNLNINHGDEVDSFPLRNNFSMAKARHNQTVAELAAFLAAASNAEVTASRPYHSTLMARLNETQLEQNYIKNGFVVRPRATPNMTVRVSAGRAQVGGSHISMGYGSWTRSGTTVTMTEYNHGRTTGNTIVVEVSSATTPLPLGEYTITVTGTNTFTITGVNSGATSGTAEFATVLGTFVAPVNTEYDVVVINSDKTLEIVLGLDTTTPVLPSISSTQRALAQITLTSANSTVDSADIRDCSTQGCWAGGLYYWKIQDAVDSLNSRSNSEDGGEVYVCKGKYYEQIVLTGLSNVTLRFENGAKLYRIANASQIIYCENTTSTRKSRIEIRGGEFYGNSKSGSVSNLHFSYVDYLSLIDVWSDGNASSSANGKDLYLGYCHAIDIRGGQTKDREHLGTLEDPPDFPADSTGVDSGGTETSILATYGKLPIGAIVAYHNSFVSGQQVAPTGWENCDGGTISDPGSPLNGSTKPNLNSKGITGTTGATGGDGSLDATNASSSDFIAMYWIIRVK